MGYNYHVEVGAYFNSSCQVPHNSIAVVASGEQHSGIEGVWLQHKHLVLVALRTDRSYNEPKISYQDTESNLYNTPYVPRYFKEHTHTVLSRKKKNRKTFLHQTFGKNLYGDSPHEFLFILFFIKYITVHTVKRSIR